MEHNEFRWRWGLSSICNSLYCYVVRHNRINSVFLFMCKKDMCIINRKFSTITCHCHWHSKIHIRITISDKDVWLDDLKLLILFLNWHRIHNSCVTDTSIWLHNNLWSVCVLGNIIIFRYWYLHHHFDCDRNKGWTILCVKNIIFLYHSDNSDLRSVYWCVVDFCSEYCR